MKKISIIVPVFNNEKYVSACICSVIEQTYHNWELILVDDGSTDKSGTICDEYCNHRNIRAIHTPNYGVNKARQEGVKHAKGEWITFLDSDDTLPKTALKNLIDASSTKTDIVIGSVTHINDAGLNGISKEEYRNYAIMGWHFHTGPVAKLFRKTLFDDFTFDIPREIIFGEDMIMNIRIAFNNQKRITVIKDLVYSYRQNEDNITNRFVTTEQYESLFTNYWLASIPQNEQKIYAQSIFRKLYDSFVSRLTNGKDNITFNSYWRSFESYNHIVEIVHKYNLKLTKGERIVLFSRPIWIANIYLKMKH